MCAIYVKNYIVIVHNLKFCTILQKGSPEFWPESKSPFYTIPLGDRSCYNHVVMVGLQAFITAKGQPDLDIYRVSCKIVLCCDYSS